MGHWKNTFPVLAAKLKSYQKIKSNANYSTPALVTETAGTLNELECDTFMKRENVQVHLKKFESRG